MQHWKRTTETANRLFEQGELVDAREHYLQALALAQVLRDAALRHSGRTYTELLNFIAEYGQYPRTERLLNRHNAGVSELAAQPDVAPGTHAYGVH